MKARDPGPGRLFGWGAAVAVLGVLPFVVPNQFFVKVLVFAGIASLLCVGLNLIFGYAGQVSLGHAAFYGIGAYTTAILTTRYGWPPVAGLAAAAVTAAAAAYLIGVPTLRLKGHYLAMATLGFNEIVAIVLVEAKPLTNGTDGISAIPPLKVASIALESNAANYYVVWGAVLVGVLVARNLIVSRSGRSVRALHDSEVAAEASAVAASSVKIKTFVISAVYAGVAGALYAHFVSFISPQEFFIVMSVTLVTMVVAGGMGTIVGPVLGAVLLTIGPEFLRQYQDYTLVFYGALLMAVMVFLPGGLASLARSKDAPR